MKITWLGKRVFRIQIGGRIIVLRKDVLPENLSASELGSGADQTIDIAHIDSLPALQALAPQQARRSPMDEEPDRPDSVTLERVENAGLAIKSRNDGKLIVAWQKFEVGRFLDGAALVVCGNQLATSEFLAELMARTRPKLLAIALADFDTDILSARTVEFDGTAVQILDPALALEI